ncbi:D-cysteine desulfhydrase family protein [Cupriavidus sp. 2TAF22]|uniref:D-cysteine desulfhydrase family protein n=1 Tax=unclassified Cupriavidus TaxID=2640874 RepID=UPI003F8EC912
MTAIDLSRFPRYTLREGVAPIQHLPRLSQYLGGADIFVKRDDIGGLGGGGNKLRKLEYLVGEALADGADTIITVGGRQSNHARLTAAAAAKAGLACELILARLVPREDADYVNSGNVLLDDLFGARVHDLPAGSDALGYANQRAEALRAQGRRVYVCPLGGSSPTGCLGYAACAVEIDDEASTRGLSFDRILVANGSGGMQAGLIAGEIACGRPAARVAGYSVLAPLEKAREDTLAKARQTLALLDPALGVAAESVDVDGSQFGPGYGQPTAGMVDALRLVATQEGILLDPVYSGKAFAGLVHDVRAGRYRKGQQILFVMSGGVPSLFAYRSIF